MKKISGDTLARLMRAIQICNEKELPIAEVKKIVNDAIDKSDLYVEVEESFDFEKINQYGKSKRMSTFNINSIAKLNSLLPWSSFAAVDEGSLLGAPFSTQKRVNITKHPDSRINALHKLIGLGGLSVLEVGCFEGHHTIDLAMLAREVWAFDGRVENVIKSLVRVWLAGIEDNVSLQLIDLEKISLNQALLNLGRTELFDLIHHRGVLYHLSDPIENLIQCASVTKKYLYLHTQIANREQINSVLEHKIGEYETYRYREPNIEFSPFSGIADHAHWLSEQSLLKLIQDLGFTNIQIINNIVEPNGKRIELIASKL